MDLKHILSVMDPAIVYSDWFNLFLYFFIAGHLFYAGHFLIFTGLVPSLVTRRKWLISTGNIAVLLGTALVLLSATPVSLWLYGLFITGMSVYLIDRQRNLEARGKRWKIALIPAVISLVMSGSALQYDLFRTVSIPSSSISIIGDSLSAGLGDDGIQVYSDRLNQSGTLTVANHAVGGSRMIHGPDMLERVDPACEVILIELGGNDYRFGGDQQHCAYRESLDRLLSRACIPGRTVIMLEVPFPPMEYRYLYYQRMLARKHGVTLIPRRFLAGILFGTPETTLDGLHLNQKGHTEFASRLKKLLVIQ